MIEEESLTRQALALLDVHLDYWSKIGDEIHLDYTYRFLRTYGAFARMDDANRAYAAKLFADTEAEMWNRAPTTLLTSDVKRTIGEAAIDAPDEVLKPELVPVTHGVVMSPDLEPLFIYESVDEVDGEEEAIPIVALAWAFQDNIGIPNEDRSVREQPGGVDLWLYTLASDMNERYADELSNDSKERLAHLHLVITDRAPWAFGLEWHAADDFLSRDVDGWHLAPDGSMQVDPHIGALRHWLIALWTFMAEEIIVMPRVDPPRHHRKRLDRAGRMAPIPEDGILRIAHLRRTKRVEREHDDEEGEPPNWSHRWYVRGHWRRLASGRLTYVRGHIKGPDDRPLVLKHNIMAVHR